jgi:hypothetical protein
MLGSRLGVERLRRDETDQFVPIDPDATRFLEERKHRGIG